MLLLILRQRPISSLGTQKLRLCCDSRGWGYGRLRFGLRVVRAQTACFVSAAYVREREGLPVTRQ